MNRAIITKMMKTKSKKLRGTRLNYNAGLQAEYVRELRKLVTSMSYEVNRRVIGLFEKPGSKEFFAMDDSIASQARILTNELTLKFEMIFNRKSKLLARKMVEKSNRISASSLQNSLKTLSGGLVLNTKAITPELQQIMSANVTENVALIKSIGAEYLSKVQKTVMRSITTGQGLKTLVPALSKYEGISRRHAKNVALDQTRKAYNSINKSRMEKIGVKKFEWVHSGGGHEPRPDHIAMSGNIYSFDDLPVIEKRTGERGIPGQAINCGCTMIPVIEFNEEE